MSDSDSGKVEIKDAFSGEMTEVVWFSSLEREITTHLKRDSPVTMANALVNFRKICSLPLVWLVSLEVSLENAPKKGFFRLNHWRFSRKAKCLMVVAIVAVLLISVFAFLPKQNVGRGNVIPQNSDNSTATSSPAAANRGNASSPLGIAKRVSQIDIGVAQDTGLSQYLIQSANTINSTVWKEIAANAWEYFQPFVGINLSTGLPYSGGTSYTAFTDWDLGVYIQAVIDAQELGLIGTGGAWDFSARIDKVLTFLENRPLNATTNYPFQFYDATTGNEAAVNQANEIADVVDTGRLFVALNNLINYNSSLKQPIDNFVYNVYDNRSDYAALVPGIASSAGSTSIYSYYVASGFASFFPSLF